MPNRFHLAVPAGDLSAAVVFYCDVLGCSKGNSEFKYPDAWVDINFWGNELTLHATDPSKPQHGDRHNVDMGNVSVPHFGVHLDEQDFIQLKARLEENAIEYIDPPYIRFKGTELQQETLFIADPHGNCLEIKTMKNPETLFRKND
tara:strand:+ start:2666 stop:3103 length:438 start_codon:yes stop_codon:yes gene_type:complete